jgi:hypothetical protein
MTLLRAASYLLAIVTLAGSASAQVMTVPPASLSSACIAHPQPNENIGAQLAKFRRIDIPFSTAGLSDREVKLVQKLVEASRYIESIFWRQSDPEALRLYQGLAPCTSQSDQQLRRFLLINGSRYNLLENGKPFIGNQPAAPSGTILPRDITQKEIDAYVAAHPDRKAAIYNPLTVVKRSGRDLVTVPYHVEYKQWLEPAAKALREAAALSDDKAFANFLRLRADALLSDNYYASDIAWVDLVNPKFDIIFAPYETYVDNLLGVKGSYGAAVMIRNEPESHKLALYEKYVADIQQALPLAAADKPSNAGHKTPMEVMDTPYRAGDLRHGYQAVADNLPNDPRIHEEKGTKKMFFKNFLDARVKYSVLPIGMLLMRADQGRLPSTDGYLSVVVLHELSHGIGPAFARTPKGRVDITEAIGPVASALEESKADVVGMFALGWLMDHGALPKSRANEYYASYVAGIFRSVRFGVAEAHGRGEMMEFNYLAEKGAISRDPATGRYAIDFAKMPGAIASLAKELLEIEATGDRARGDRWFAKYDQMPATLKAALAKAGNVPVDLDPHTAFGDEVR